LNPIPICAYKLDLFEAPPLNFSGLLYSFFPYEGVECIDLTEDPFQSVKEAVIQSLGAPCGLIRQGSCFFSDLFISLYEQLSLLRLEIKDGMQKHVEAFLGKQLLTLGQLEFSNPQSTAVIMVGKGNSLHRDIDILKRLQDKALLVCSYSVLPILKEYGIYADIAFASDPNQQKHEAINAHHLLIAPKTSAVICEGFKTISLFPVSWCSFSGYLFKGTPHPPVYGYTIMDIALKFLIQSGFKQFYLSGVDLPEMGGLYADKQPCGYKPDFKKAKEHIGALKRQHKGIKFLKNIPKDLKLSKQVVVTQKPLEGVKRLEEFKQSFDRIKILHFPSLGLYEMFLLEQEPFYQVVLDPLYEKWLLLQTKKELTKLEFFQQVMHKFNQGGLK